MLVQERRMALTTLCLAGLEAAWLTPWLLLVSHFLGWRWEAWPTFALLCGGVVAWMLLIDLLNFLEVDAPLYQIAVLALMAVSTLLLVRLLFYPGLPLGDPRWLGETGRAFFDFESGLRLELALVFVNVLLWQRAAAIVGRRWFSLIVRARMGRHLALLVVGGGLLNHCTDAAPLFLLWVALALGAAALTLVRPEEGYRAHSKGGGLGGRLVQNVALLWAGVGLAAGLGALLTPRVVERLLTPLWAALAYLYALVLLVVFNVGQVVIPAVIALARFLLGEREEIQFFYEAPDLPSDPGAVMPGNVAPVELLISPEVGRFVIVALIVGGLAVVVLLSLRRQRRTPGPHGEEQEDVTGAGSLGGFLGRVAGGLRGALGELGGLGRRFSLLDAISVRNIYANVVRLATREGYPRPPACPPDRYLATLVQACPGEAESLATITEAYMRVHYGDRPVSAEDLAEVKAAYASVREAFERAEG